MHLAERLLAQGKRVRLFVRRPDAVEELRQSGAEVVVGSLDDADAIERAVDGVETVFNLAAMTAAIRPDDMLRVNGDGSRLIAAACAAQWRKPLLVQVSSIAASGPAKRCEVRKETDAPAPVSNYGRSKLAGEQAVAEFAAEIPITIIRPGIVFGPRNREMLPMFKSIKFGGLHAVPGWRSPALSILHVDDCVDVILAAASRGSRLPACEGTTERLTAGRGVYFAVGPEYPSYFELGRLMRSALNCPRAFVLQMGNIPWLAAAMTEQVARIRGKPNSFNLDKIREARVESWACSGELAEQELGFSVPRPLTERLQATVDWYRQERWL
jgi:nucleoside-diphosphate-sugar epimerase